MTVCLRSICARLKLEVVKVVGCPRKRDEVSQMRFFDAGQIYRGMVAINPFG